MSVSRRWPVSRLYEGSVFLFRNEQHEKTVSIVMVIWGEDFVLVKVGKCVTILKQNFVMFIG